jgi:hypothetical protein
MMLFTNTAGAWSSRLQLADAMTSLVTVEQRKLVTDIKKTLKRYAGTPGGPDRQLMLRDRERLIPADVRLGSVALNGYPFYAVVHAFHDDPVHNETGFRYALFAIRDRPNLLRRVLSTVLTRAEHVECAAAGIAIDPLTTNRIAQLLAEAEQGNLPVFPHWLLSVMPELVGLQDEAWSLRRLRQLAVLDLTGAQTEVVRTLLTDGRNASFAIAAGRLV